jgi:alkaline phosphatase D
MSTRRAFVFRLSSAAVGAALAPRAAPALVTRDAARPGIEHGAMVGDVTGDAASARAIVWSRTDRPARIVVEWSTRDSFADARRLVGPAALPETGFTARVDLADLPRDQTIVYRVSFQDLGDLKTFSLPVQGRFRSAPDPSQRAGAVPARGGVRPAPAASRSVRLAWGADTVGQGFGIDAARGGLRTYETMRRLQPDFFVHTGDTIYADNPLVAELPLDDGSVWRNLVTPAKSKVAETLDEFRGNHLYNLLDENVRRFNAEVPQLALWDDHEVRNNWYPTQILEDARYTEKSVALLAARARRAFLEHTPTRYQADELERVYRKVAYGPLVDVFAIDMRSYRGPNTPNRQTGLGPESALLGAPQLEWLKQGLATSTAVWKVVASDMPLGLVVRDGSDRFEAVANGDPGAPLGRELELAELLAFLRAGKVRNVVWITGDVHYAAAHHYHPERAAFRDFDPFWEFVAGPLHAGTFGPTPLDATFGPSVSFLAIPDGMKPNRPPSDGLQFFGTLDADHRSGVLTARLHDVAGRVLYTNELVPEPPFSGRSEAEPA